MRSRMARQKRVGTKPEVVLRKLLHRAGLRYRVAYPVPSMPRKTIDIAFPGRKVAIFVDGCFWHACPEHGVSPRNNSEWWLVKLESNRRRDAETTAALESSGWTVIRLWEHEVPDPGLSTVLACLDFEDESAMRTD